MFELSLGAVVAAIIVYMLIRKYTPDPEEIQDRITISLWDGVKSKDIDNAVAARSAAKTALHPDD
jgi:hypothetical protein